MSFTAIIGLQWGDEGKGKIVDYLAEKHDVVVRFQGGANAGHTVSVGGKEFIFHIIPSGLLRPQITGAIGAGVAVDPDVLMREMEEVGKLSAPLDGRFWIDGRAQLVLPYHKAEDRWEEELMGGIGTTRRGIGPAYRDRYYRIGLRAIDLLSSRSLEGRLRHSLDFNNQILGARYGKPPYDFHEIYEFLKGFGDRIGPFIRDVSVFLLEEARKGKHILLEGAQGSFLDINFGTYPFVTSSHTISGGASVGAGVPPNAIKRIIGVTKAYTTRVGKGPFPTELKGPEGDHLRERGGEYGATTGRPRRCGWLDLVALRFSAWINGISELAITKLDSLAEMDVVKVARSYSLGGKELLYPPLDLSDWYSVKVNYEEFRGWGEIGSIRRREDLPGEAKEYLNFIEDNLKIPITYISVGKERDQIIIS